MPQNPSHQQQEGDRRKLSTFDITNLVVGSIIGADIYIVTAIGSRLVGPASLIVWLVAGLMALIIALSFSYCVMIEPKVGGPYAYTKEVAGPFAGFMIGWALLLAELFSLSVFPVAFAQYFSALVPGIDAIGQALLKGVFISIVIITNIVGTKVAGKANDALTIIKLSPLVLVILGGLAFIIFYPGAAVSHFEPFFIDGVGGAGQALILIFWAYAGFELSTLPTEDVEEPTRTVPRSIVIGMLIVAGFYLLTNFAVMASLDQTILRTSSSPLIDSATAIFSPQGGAIGVVALFVGVGALLSILGADESGTLSTSRLAYAMSLDGFLPHALSRKHGRFNTPYLAILALGLTAFIISLLGGLTVLISSAVLLLAIVYLATCLSAIVLLRRNPQKTAGLRGRRLIPLTGAMLSIMLILLVRTDVAVMGMALLAVGVPVYIFFSPQRELTELKEVFLSREERIKWERRQSERFLAYPLHHLNNALKARRRALNAARLNGQEKKDKY